MYATQIFSGMPFDRSRAAVLSLEDCSLVSKKLHELVENRVFLKSNR